MQIDMAEFYAAFFEEAAEHLATLETELLSLESTPDDLELLNTIFRAAHSIKGASGMLGFDRISKFTHALENLLDQLREGTMQSSPGLVELLLRATDTLGHLIGGAEHGELEVGIELEIIDELQAALRTSEQQVDEEPVEQVTEGVQLEHRGGYSISFTPAVDLFRQGMDPGLILADLARLGELTETRCDCSRVPPLYELVPDSCYLAWTTRLKSDRQLEELQDVFLFVEDGALVSIRPDEPVTVEATVGQGDGEAVNEEKTTSAARNRGNESIRVSVDKVEELINLVGELVIANSMVRQAMESLPNATQPLLQEAMTAMDRSTRELQEQVMAVRMLPIGTVFRRFPRLVRDLANNLGKKITLRITGEDTELDKQVIEEIGDPLTHLIRNSVDHGIESPEGRLAAGKSEEGEVHLNAYHEGGNVIVDITDDGRGLDTERIRRKGIEQGLISESTTLSDDDIHMLVFAPGFSTAATVSDVSGRGVGMDVVRRNVESLKGSVQIKTQLGHGTTFRIKLPLTMAILDGLSVSLGGEVYVLPMLSVLESFRPRPGEVKEFVGTGEVVMVRGEPVALLRLHRLLNIQHTQLDPAQGLIVIVEHQGRKAGLLVDELLGQLQVVMKSLEANYQRVHGISGATILGDGRVAFILDIAGIMAISRGNLDQLDRQ